MNEGKKTGIFWTVAAVLTAAAVSVAMPRTSTQEDVVAGNQLFETFTDPLTAASMKIVTFDEAQGTLETFEVRKDRATGAWTIPSRDGYPADAMEQMKDAANALVGIKILDIQTSNAEDHDSLGVAEPKLEDLQVGDDGVGRLVTFKDDKQNTLASLIIGDAVKDDEAKRYVRIPNQDPVYVVKLDQSMLTTNFRDWIEDDLLQLTSIDIETVNIKDYTATLGGRGISLTRNYSAEVAMEGSQWTLKELLEFDPSDPRVEPTKAEMGDDDALNSAKLNEMKDALDDLKIVNVYRKPEGVSATLKASADLLSDQDAISSLAQRGFYPIDAGPNGEAEILSANGEMSVSLKNGVKYVLRFGNIAGVGDAGAPDDADGGSEGEAGVNRYLLVTTMVDAAKFPAPDLSPIPQSVEELDAMLNPPAPDQAKDVEPEPTASESEKPADAPEMKDDSADEKPADEKPADDKPADDKPAVDKPADDKPVEASGAPPEMKDEAPASKEDSVVEEAAEAGVIEVQGSGQASGSGQAQESVTEPQADQEPAVQPEPAEDGEPKADEARATIELTKEEQQERLEAAQEKITKDNQRKLDARKDQLEAAERSVRELNERFADWYYVIPETTYGKLRISREALFSAPTADDLPPAGTGGPQFQMPGLPGMPGFPGN